MVYTRQTSDAGQISDFKMSVPKWLASCKVVSRIYLKLDGKQKRIKMARTVKLG